MKYYCVHITESEGHGHTVSQRCQECASQLGAVVEGHTMTVSLKAAKLAFSKNAFRKLSVLLAAALPSRHNERTPAPLLATTMCLQGRCNYHRNRRVVLLIQVSKCCTNSLNFFTDVQVLSASRREKSCQSYFLRSLLLGVLSPLIRLSLDSCRFALVPVTLTSDRYMTKMFASAIVYAHENTHASIRCPTVISALRK